MWGKLSPKDTWMELYFAFLTIYSGIYDYIYADA